MDDEQVFGLTFVVSKPNHVVKSIGYCYGSWGYYSDEPIYFEDNGFFIGKTACVSVTGMYKSSSERFFAVNANKLEKGKELTIGVYASNRVCDEEHPVPTTEPLEVEVNVYISTSEDPVTQIPEDYEGYVYFGVRHNNSDDLPYFSYLVVA